MYFMDQTVDQEKYLKSDSTVRLRAAFHITCIVIRVKSVSSSSGGGSSGRGCVGGLPAQRHRDLQLRTKGTIIHIQRRAVYVMCKESVFALMDDDDDGEQQEVEVLEGREGGGEGRMRGVGSPEPQREGSGGMVRGDDCAAPPSFLSDTIIPPHCEPAVEEERASSLCPLCQTMNGGVEGGGGWGGLHERLLSPLGARCQRAETGRSIHALWPILSH